MAGLYITNGQSHGVTLVPNRFIDRYLPAASGEFVKVYLLLLRQCPESGELSVARLADELDNTEKDVLRALKYWEKTGLLRLEYNGSGALAGIALLDGEPCRETAVEETYRTAAPTAASGYREAALTEEKTAEEQSRKADGQKPDLKALESDEDFGQLLYLAGRYTGRNLTARDCDVLANLYGNLKMSAELLEYLLEYCVCNGHKSIRYIETVALDWKKRGITTVEQARAETVMGGKNTYAVLKAFGLGGRNPAAGERKVIDRWFKEYGFPVEVVLEACDRTMRTIHQPSFEYADKILAEWRKKGVQKKEDIERLDGKQRRAPKKEQKKPNSFHNFTQRDYDYDELIKELNGF